MKRNLHLSACVRVFAICLFVFSSFYSRATDFVVSNSANSGAGSLRQAILDANASAAVPHTITFTVSGIITIPSSLPTITRQVTIDGGNTVTISGPGGNNLVALLVLGAGSNGSTIRNLTMQNTGLEPIRLSVALTGITIENMILRQTSTHYMNRAILANAAVTNLTIRKVTVTGLEDKMQAIYFGGNVTNVLIDSFNLSAGGGMSARGIHVVGVVNGFTLKNSLIDLDDPATNDDGDYGIVFSTNVSNVTIDTTVFRDNEVNALYFGGTATNVSIKNSQFDNLDGWVKAKFVYFRNTTNTVTIEKNIFNAKYRTGVDDGDFAVLLSATTNQHIDILNNQFNENDSSAIFIGGNALTNNHDDVLIQSNTFTRNGNGGGSGTIEFLSRNTTSDGVGGAVLITENTFTDNRNINIYVRPGNTTVYTLPNFTISKNTIYNTKSTYGAIRVNYVRKVNITQNSIYNNQGIGIDLAGAANCGYEGTNVPQILSSVETSAGSGVYNVTVKLPALCGTNACSVEIFSNEAGVKGVGGQHYVTTVSGLGSGNRVLNGITGSFPEITAAPYGFWTATLKVPGSCGTSEFSNKKAIKPNGPAGINNGIALWLRGDEISVANAEPTASGQTITGWEEFSGVGPSATTVINNPLTKLSGINFNPVADMDADGIRGHFAGAPSWITTPTTTTVAVFNPLSTTASGDRLFCLFAQAGADYNTNAAQIEFYRTGNNINSYRGNTLLNPAIPGTTGVSALNRPGVFSSVTSATNHTSYYNGAGMGSGNYNKGNFAISQWFIGTGWNSTDSWNSMAEVDFAEVFTYNRVLTATELQRVQSYMALKYGIAMKQNYVLNNGTLVWDVTANATHSKEIAALVRDNVSVLHQKQAKAFHADEVVTIAVGDALAITNNDKTDTVINNLSAFMWGNDSAAVTYTQAFTAGTYSSTRMPRVWKVQKTNWADRDITIQVKGAKSNNYLLISNTSAFTTITQELQLSSTGTITISSSLLADGTYFTIGRQQKAPGGVLNGLTTWTKADEGVTRSGTNAITWEDQSSSQRIWNKVNTNALTWNSAAMNYNPAIQFPGPGTPANYFTYSPQFTPTFTQGEIFSVQSSAIDNVEGFPWQLGGTSGTTVLWYRHTSNNMYLHWGTNTRRNFSYAPKNLALPVILNVNTLANSWTASLDGKVTSGPAAYTTSFAQQGSNNALGVAYGSYFNGPISEIILYNRKLNATERLQVNSYMAIRYGITLDQTTPTNYLASDGTTRIWTAADNAGYTSNIAGIGRDEIGSLYQKQSRSINTATSGNLIAVAVGNELAATNADNTDTIVNNKSFLAWGDNNGAITYTTNVTGNNVTLRMPRVWKVDKTNWATRDITIKLFGSASNTYLLISNASGTFATIDQELPMNPDSTITISSDLLPDGAYFTFAKQIVGPGYVNAGVQVWLRADDGLSANNVWFDYSGNDADAEQAVVANQPELTATANNFNPAYRFNGTTDYLDVAYRAAFNQNVTAYTVHTQSVASGFRTPISSRNSTSSMSKGWNYYRNGNIRENWTGLNTNTWSILTGGATTLNVPEIIGMDATLGSGNSAKHIYSNGQTVGTTTTGTYITNATAPLRVGAISDGPTLWWNGDIAETVVYNRVLTAAEQKHVESYLALKYGITLNQTAPTDYVATDWDGSTGTKMWTASKNGAYNKNIAGIGRDDKTVLYQKQSRSSSDTLITVAAGSTVAVDNASNGAEIEDLSFFTWADDGGAATFSTATTGVPNATFRMVRVWKVDRTNWSDQTLTFKAAQGGERYLLVNATDPAFGAGTTEYPMSTVTGTVSLSSADLPDGAFFTLATKIVGPACVNNGIVAWLRADYAAAPNSWADFSGNQSNAAQATAANQPVLAVGSLNYNTALTFNGSTRYLQIPQASIAGKFPAGNAARTLIGVGVSTASTDQLLFSYGSFVANQASGLRKQAALVATFEGSGAANGIVGPANSYPNNKSTIISGRYTGGAGGTASLYTNGTTAIASGPMSWATTISAEGAQIGKYVGENRYWNGNIGEVIVYNRDLTDAEFQRVSSYLALKYGITLNQTVATDYIASDGTTRMWTATDNTGYNYRITGIGRDDCTDLYQKQSLSAETGGILAMAIGDAVEASNTDNTNTIDNNNSYFVFADDNASVLYNTELTGSQDLTVRMQRTWKVDKTNWTDAGVTFKLTGGTDKIYMVVSADNVFDGSDATYQLDGSGNVTIPTDQLGDASYFTFAKALNGPGYVNVGVQFWLRADDNVSTVDSWLDYSGNDNNAVQATAANQPVFVTNSVNYNPAFDFDGTDDYMDFATNAGITGSNPFTVASVSVRNVVGTADAIIAQQGNTAGNLLVQHSSANQYAIGLTGTGSVISTGVYPTVNMPYLSSGTRAGNLFSLYTNGNADGTGTQAYSFSTANLRLGNRAATADAAYNGHFNEVVVYNRALSVAELLQVHSYLALKYGISKTGDYIATDGTTTYWTAASSVGYTNNIAGIGRDDKTALYQKQSRSVNTASSGNMVAMGLTSIAATNKDNTATMSDDLSFLVWGDNAGTGTQMTEYPTALDPGSCSKITRLQREWRVQKTGTVDDVQLEVNLTGFVNSSTGQSDLKLLIDDDGNFANGGTTIIDPTSYNSSTKTVVFNGLSFGDAQYFTIVTDLTNQAPGGVVNGLYAWYRADKGVTLGTGVSTWADQSVSLKDATQATAGSQPVYNTTSNLINFNPTLSFDGTNDVLSNTTISHTGSSSEAMFAVVLPDAVAGTHNIVGLGTGASSTNSTEFRFVANKLAWGTGAPYIEAINPATSDGIAQLASVTHAVSGSIILTYNGTNVASGTNAVFPTLNYLNIGARRYSGANNQFFKGRVAEVAIYNLGNSITERLRIISYLAIKYGITLPNHYVDPADNRIWDATINAGYGFNITGIARDDCNGLHQKQSKSVNAAEALVTIGNYTGIYTTNAANPNTLDNNTSLLFGDDNGSRAAFVATNAPQNRERITRTWKVQEKGNVSTVTIQVPSSTSANAIKLPLERDGVVYLLVSNTTDFTTATEVPMTLNGTEWETTYDFTDGQYFTFATNSACVSVAPLLTTYGVTTNAAVDKCYVDGWILFKDPVDATKYIAGIYDPAALIDRTKITATVNVNSAFADLGEGSSTSAVRLMRRMLQVDCASCFDDVANPAPNFTVRMFYNSTEKSDAESVETNNMESIKTTYSITDAHFFKWFKASERSVAQVVSSLTATGIPAGGQEWFDGQLATGDIGGVEYIDFPGINSFSTFGGMWAVNLNAVLPVTWLGVQAVPVDNQKIVVKWSTASEEGNAGFDVQRSEDGLHFSTINHVAGSGNSTSVSHYSVEDNQVEQGKTYYYRIRQADYNGHISYSATVSARLQSEGMTVLVSPNPANHSSKVLITVNRQQVMQVMLTNISGQVLNSSKVIVQRGLNTHTLDLSRYSDGTYFIRVVADDGTVDTKKIIVQKTH